MVYPMPTKDHELIAEVDVDAVVIDETQSHLTKEVNDAIDAVIASSAVASCMPNPQDDMMSEDVLNFKADPIRAQVADVSCTYDPEIFDELVSKRAAQTKFGEAIGSTANPQDSDVRCELFEGAEAIEFIASASHAEKPYGVTAEMLEKV